MANIQRKKIVRKNWNRISPCEIDGTVYNSIKAAGEKLNMPAYTIRQRIRSKKWSEYNYRNDLKSPKLTPTQLKERKRQISEEANQRYKDDGYFSNYYKDQLKNDEKYLLSSKYKGLVYHALKYGTSIPKAEALLGCTLVDFKKHLTDKCPDFFDLWGRGNGKYSLDHILPISSFDLTKEDQVKLCFNYKNYQPLSNEENRKKSNKIILDDSLQTEVKEKILKLLMEEFFETTLV